MTDDQYTVWLKSLKRGDNVLLRTPVDGHYFEKICTVFRVTKTLIVVDCFRFRLKNGQCVDGGRTTIDQVTIEHLERDYRRKMMRRLSGAMADCSIYVLERMVACLPAEPPSPAP